MKFIAYLDILGFKQLAENNSLDKLIEIYRKVFDNSYEQIITLLKDNIEMNTKDGWPKFNLKGRIISDSIILWNDNDSWEGFAGLLLLVRSKRRNTLKRINRNRRIRRSRFQKQR